MPENIIQFQVVAQETQHIVYALTQDGKIYFKNPSVGNGAWQQLS